MSPGAGGCTPKTLGCRDEYRALLQFEVVVCGLSTQITEYQQKRPVAFNFLFRILNGARYR